MIPEGEFEGFRVEEVLSRSSTATVYRAFQHSLKRPVLIKELRPELIQDKDVLERFEREAQVCARIKHENIVDIYDRSMQKDRIFLIMEYVKGGSLESLLADYPRVPPTLALAIILQTLRGLAYAHSQGVIHRDIKPGNILISRDGWVKITDFGLSMLEGAPGITQPGAVVGTPAYLAPEAISGAAITQASDIFSLGVTFYQLLTGQKIFYAEHFSDSLKKVLNYHPPPLGQWRDDLSPELDRIVLRMLEKQPSKRWSNAGDILSALENQGLTANLSNPKQIIREYWENPNDHQQEVTPSPTNHYLKVRKRGKLIRWLSLAIFVLAVIVFVMMRREPVPIINEGLKSQTPGIMTTDTVKSLTARPQSDTLNRETINQDTLAIRAGAKPDANQSGDRSSVSRTDPIKIEPKPTPIKAPSKQEPPPVQLADARPARLKVQCDPWADVYMDDVLIDKTPFESASITPGRHQLAFRHPAFPPVFREIDAKPGQDIQLNVNLWSTVGRIYVLVDTWAEIHVDGRKVGVTPLQEPLIVPLGVHKIELKNPNFPLWERDITFQRDDPPCTLKVDFKTPHGLLTPQEHPVQSPADSLRLGSNVGTVGGDSLRP
jgi:serine/threonine-protein kinase